MNPTLVKLAKISPKSYADRILNRNEELLRKLMLLKPYVGKDKEIPDSVAKEVMSESYFGCPHCVHNCDSCLWSRASHNESTCYDVPFSQNRHHGITLRQIGRLHTIWVNYYFDSEDIEIVDITREDFNKCVDFVKAHIEWAKLPIWGSEYKKQ